MNRPAPLLSSVLSLVTIAGCAATEPSRRASAATQPIAATQPAYDPAAVAREIDSIIYSDLPREQMLEKLEPFVALIDSKDDFTRKTGLQLGGGFGSGPGVMTYSIDGCGLRLVVDPDQKIRIIQRSEKSVGDKNYPRMSVSEPGFEWKGYVRWYPY